MEKNLLRSTKMKFDKLSQGEKTLALIILFIILGGILFNSGVEIGKAFSDITK